MADFFIDGFDDATMDRIEKTARFHGLSVEDWAREIIIALAEKREPDFERARVTSTSDTVQTES